MRYHAANKTSASPCACRDAIQRSNADADAALSVCEREIKETHSLSCHKRQHKGHARIGGHAGVARACGNLGTYYQSTGEYARAIEHRGASHLGNRAGMTTACGLIMLLLVGMR